MDRQWEEFLIELGLTLKYARQNRGLTMNIVDEIEKIYGLKMHQSYLSRIENGKLEISLHALLVLADFYGLSVPALLQKYTRNRETDRVFEQLQLDYRVSTNIEYCVNHLGKDRFMQYLKQRIGELTDIIKQTSDRIKTGGHIAADSSYHSDS